jgi:primosomal protein N'
MDEDRMRRRDGQQRPDHGTGDRREAPAAPGEGPGAQPAAPADERAVAGAPEATGGGSDLDAGPRRPLREEEAPGFASLSGPAAGARGGAAWEGGGPRPPEPDEAAAAYAEVALPVPLPDPLTYAVPAGWSALAVPGVRVRARLGKRLLIGIVVGRRDEPPAGVAVRWLEGLLDREPVLGPDLLALARFTADYYLAPIGEVLRTMLPGDLEPWGDRRVWLTDRGALALPRGDAERAVLEALRQGGRVTVSELQARLGLPDLDATLADLEAAGRIAGEESHTRPGRPGRSPRYVAAVELAPHLGDARAPAAGDPAAARRAAAGRSAQGLAVVEYLAAVGRPATAAEVMAAAGCGSGVLKRLVSRGVLRQFTQVEKLSLDRHRLPPLPSPQAAAPPGQQPGTAAATGAGPAATDADSTAPAETGIRVAGPESAGPGGASQLEAGTAGAGPPVRGADSASPAAAGTSTASQGGPGAAGPAAAGHEPPLFRLRPDQEAAVAAVVAAISARRFQPMLLRGITGSGKTEVYLRAAAAALAQGRSAILLVPEIALVPALARAVIERFGERLAILHSGLGAGERNQEWERVRRGEAMVVLGPRSALFAPVADLGLLVVDEEQDPAYKQELTPRYHARDLALVRGRGAAAVTLLVSATPSLESRHNVERGKLGLLTLTARVGQGSLPEGILVDLRQEEGVRRRPGDVHFSARLRREIALSLAAGEQVILLRNRRGYAPMLLCRACGEAMRCPDCGLPRTYHRRARRLLCHYCGSAINAPEVCPSCSENALEPIGAGTERVEEDFREIFPGVAVDVLDRDATRRPGGLAAVLERFERGDTRVLVGTQMVSKGHHFPRVSLTAVLAADSYLSFPDFRAVERTYNLLTQVAGRAGRGERPGRVVIQTFHPDHYAVQAALTGDDAAFVEEEMRFRRAFHYPPFTRMVQLLVRDRKRERAAAGIQELADALVAHPLGRAVRLTGPAPAPFERLRGEWRFQLLARAADFRDLHRLLVEVLPKSPAYDLTIDIDPQQLL